MHLPAFPDRKDNRMNKLAIVVPCYNEEEVLDIAAAELKQVLNDLIAKEKISKESFVLFVDDGSKDKTWELIEKQHKASEQICGLKAAGYDAVLVGTSLMKGENPGEALKKLRGNNA